MLKYFLIGYIGVLLTAIAQIILKFGAIKKVNNGFLTFFINVYTFLGYGLMFGITLINLYIYRYLDIKYSLIFLPSTYILVFLFSSVILKEKIDRSRAIQYGIILLGVIIFNI
jgi:drug/metabolite transporter (DMT)-like permease